MEIFNALKAAILNAEKDAEKFFAKGNNSAGTRLRSSMQEVKQLAQQVRTEVSTARNTAAEVVSQ